MLPANPRCPRHSRVRRSLLRAFAGPQDDPVNGPACPGFAILGPGIVARRSWGGNLTCYLTIVLVLVLVLVLDFETCGWPLTRVQCSGCNHSGSPDAKHSSTSTSTSTKNPRQVHRAALQRLSSHGSVPRRGPATVRSRMVLVGEVAYSVREKPHMGVSILMSTLTSRSLAEASSR